MSPPGTGACTRFVHFVQVGHPLWAQGGLRWCQCDKCPLALPGKGHLCEGRARMQAESRALEDPARRHQAPSVPQDITPSQSRAHSQEGFRREVWPGGVQAGGWAGRGDSVAPGRRPQVPALLDRWHWPLGVPNPGAQSPRQPLPHESVLRCRQGMLPEPLLLSWAIRAPACQAQS